MSKVYNVPVQQTKAKPLIQESQERQLKVLLELVAKLMDALKSPKPFSEYMAEILDKLNYFRKQLGEQVPESVESILKNIYDSLECSSCKTEPSIVKLNCGHIFCESCLNSVVCNSVDLKCQVCSSPFSPYEISEQFALSYFERFNLRVSGKCIQCTKSSSDVLDCGHLCSQCVSVKFWKNDCVCEKCSQKFEPPECVFERQVKCFGCDEMVYLVGDFAFNLEGHQTFCLPCLKQVKEKGVCVSCERPLNDLEMSLVLRFLYSRCSKCRSEKTVDQFLPKGCCSEPLCCSCQGEDSKCTLCKTMLDGRSLTVLSRFYSN